MLSNMSHNATIEAQLESDTSTSCSKITVLEAPLWSLLAETFCRRKEKLKAVLPEYLKAGNFMRSALSCGYVS